MEPGDFSTKDTLQDRRSGQREISRCFLPNLQIFEAQGLSISLLVSTVLAISRYEREIDINQPEKV
jgi:hypothetical protein